MVCGCGGGACGGPACGWAGVVYAGTGEERWRTWIWARRWSVDGGAIGGGLSSDAPRLLGKGEGCRPGGAVGVPCVRRGAAADPRGCEPRGRLSRRRTRDRFDRAVPSLRRRRRRWGSAATVSPAGTTGRLSSGVTGVSRVSGGCVGGTGLTSIDNASRRVATGRWLPPSRPTPSGVSLVGQRSAARCRRSGWKRCPV